MHAQESRSEPHSDILAAPSKLRTPMWRARHSSCNSEYSSHNKGASDEELQTEIRPVCIRHDCYRRHAVRTKKTAGISTQDSEYSTPLDEESDKDREEFEETNLRL